MNKVSLIPLVGLFMAIRSHSKSTIELSAKYPVVTSYGVRPGILMTPKYSDDGQVCEMSFERQRATRSGVVMMDSSMSDERVKDVVDELVPDSERGPALEGNGIMMTTGGTTEFVYMYEKIRYNVFRGPHRENVVLIVWQNRNCKAESQPLPIEQYPR